MLDWIRTALTDPTANALVLAVLVPLFAWLGLPLVVKEPGKLPAIGRLFGKVTDDFDVGMKDLRELEAINQRANVSLEDRKARLRERFETIVAKLTEPQK